MKPGGPGAIGTVAGAALVGWAIGTWIDQSTGFSVWAGNVLGGDKDYLPADPKVKKPKNSRGGNGRDSNNSGRGDDPEYSWTKEELLEAIDAAREAKDTTRLKQLLKIHKERFRGPRNG